jgi:hypothetical protein
METTMTKPRDTFADLATATTMGLATRLLTDPATDAELLAEAERYLMIAGGRTLDLDDLQKLPPALLRVMRALLVGAPSLRAHMLAAGLVALESYQRSESASDAT